MTGRSSWYSAANSRPLSDGVPVARSTRRDRLARRIASLDKRRLADSGRTPDQERATVIRLLQQLADDGLLGGPPQQRAVLRFSRGRRLPGPGIHTFQPPTKLSASERSYPPPLR
jgi:hypothetical protein